MAADPSAPSVTGVPAAFSRALEAYTGGRLSLAALGAEVSALLAREPASAEAMHQQLDLAMHARRLPLADYGELVDVLATAVSENEPTEYSDETPHGQGTFRLANDRARPMTSPRATAELTMHTSPSAESRADNPAPKSAVNSPPSVPAVPLPGTLLRNRFRLETRVAGSHLCLVYRATDLLKVDAGADAARVALKLLKPHLAHDARALQVFRNEVITAQRLSHPNIVHVHELDVDGDYHFITMEWLEGESLAARLDHGSPPGASEIDSILAALCSALSHAHAHGVVHADVKPGNVFLTRDGGIRLIDFGIAADMDVSNASQGLGLTRAYASCERLESQPPTPADDVYALACLAYRLLAGRRPYDGLDALEAERAQATLDPIAGLAPQRWAALRQALALRRDARTRSVEEFARLYFAPADLPVTASAATAMPAVEPALPAATAVTSRERSASILRHPMWPLLGLLLAVGAGVWLWQKPGAGDRPAPAAVDSVPATAGAALQPLPGDSPPVEAVLTPADVAVDSDTVSTPDEPVPATTAPAEEVAASNLQEAQPRIAAVPSSAAAPMNDEGRSSQASAGESAVAPRSDDATVAAAATGSSLPASAGPAVNDGQQLVADVNRQSSGPAAGAESALQASEAVAVPVSPAPSAPEPLDAATRIEAVGVASESPAGVPPIQGSNALTDTDADGVAAAGSGVDDLPTAATVVFDPREPVPLSTLEFVTYVEPRYPYYQVDPGYNGWVDVEFRVGMDGRTRDIRVRDSNLPPRFENSAVVAVRRWRFQPYQHEGRAVAVATAVRLRFEY